MTAPANPGAYPTAAGQPSYSGTFIPIIWSSKFIVKYYLNSVFAAISNTDYEGEISNFGDTIYIPLVPDMTIRKYYDGMDLETDRPRGDNIEMPIRRGHYFNALVTDLAQKQASIPFLDKWSDDASQKMRIKVDGEMLAEVYAEAHVDNAGATAGAISQNVNLGVTGTPFGVTTANVIDLLTNITQVLDEQNVPQEGRWVVVPAWFATRIKRSELRDASITGDATSPMRNGLIGSIDTIGNVYLSNNLLPVDDGGTPCWHVIAGTNDAITFASQMTNMENFRSPNTFGDLMRGMQVYDFKVIKPEALVDAYVTPA